MPADEGCRADLSAVASAKAEARAVARTRERRQGEGGPPRRRSAARLTIAIPASRHVAWRLTIHTLSVNLATFSGFFDGAMCAPRGVHGLEKRSSTSSEAMLTRAAATWGLRTTFAND